MQAGQEAGLLEVVDAVRQDAAGDHDQEAAGPGEERAQVDRDRALVDEHAEHHRGEQAEGRSQERLPGRRDGADGVAGGGVGGRPQEQGGLQALAADGEHGDDHQGPATAVGGPVDRTAQLAAEPAGRPRHPEDHPGDEADRDDRQQAPDQLLGLEGEPARAVGQRRPEGEADRDRDRDPGPDPGQQVGALGLHQVGHQDAHDERGLEPLAEPDQVVGEHPPSLRHVLRRA